MGRGSLGAVIVAGGLAVLLAAGAAARAQAPPDAQGIANALTQAAGGAAPAAPAAPAAEEVAAPTADNPEATVVESDAPVDVAEPIDEAKIRDFLQKTLPRYQGVQPPHHVKVDVDGGAVTLSGWVEDENVRDRLRDAALRVKGVTLVANQLKTDAQVMTARQLVTKRLQAYLGIIEQKWLLAVLAVAIFIASIVLARFFGAYSEPILSILTGNVLLRSVLGSLLGGLIVVGGTFASLTVLGLSQAVLSVMGLAGVVALAIGFAFRDITENFIASVLLGFRRPFRIGDYVTVAGQAGIVRTLNTRATVLVTLEGNQIRIPNSVIFKEVLVNSSASESVRGTFDVLVPYEASTSAAMEAVAGAVGSHEGVLANPPARTLVDSLEPSGVRLRTYFWMPTKGVDGFKLNSDVRLKAKVALQERGITPPASPLTLTVAGEVPVRLRPPDDPHAAAVAAPRPGAALTADQARANLLHDSRAADAADDASGRDADLTHALSAAQDRVGDEGENLLAGGDHNGHI